MNSKTTLDSNSIESEILKEDINFKELLEIIIRYKKVIIAFTGAGIVLGGIYAICQKRIWEGQFKIVLADTKSDVNPITRAAQTLSGIINIQPIKSELNTQVEILKSPSVLMPIFEGVKFKKELSGKKVKNWKYQNWVNESVKINLKKGTTVLIFNYRDTDKDLILPTLNNVSKTFQNYSGKQKKTGLEDGITYLEEKT